MSYTATSTVSSTATSTVSSTVTSTVTTVTSVVDPPAAFNCTAHPLPVQVLKSNTAGNHSYTVSELDYTTGTYSIIYTLFPTVSSSRNLQVNAVGFNPVDNKTYGMLKYKIDTTAHSFFVRFDVFSIEYLGKMDLSYSGMVNRDGDFYFLSNSSKTLKKIKNAQLVTGVTTRANNHYIGASQLSSLSFQPLGTTVATRSNLGLSSVAIPLDIVQLFANIEGDAPRDYIVGYSRSQKVIVIYDNSTGYGAWALDATYE